MTINFIGFDELDEMSKKFKLLAPEIRSKISQSVAHKMLSAAKWRILTKVDVNNKAFIPWSQRYAKGLKKKGVSSSLLLQSGVLNKANTAKWSSDEAIVFNNMQQAAALNFGYKKVGTKGKGISHRMWIGASSQDKEFVASSLNLFIRNVLK